MKKLLMILLLSSNAHAYSSYNDELECAEKVEYSRGVGVSISCVSKASIAKDKAELKLIKLQIKKIELELKAMEQPKEEAAK